MDILYGRLLVQSKGGQREEKGGIVSWRNRFAELDRSDGPALLRKTSAARQVLLREGILLPLLEYWRAGQRHRLQGPAVIFDIREAFLFSSPLWEYWQDGELHRTTGPARVFFAGGQWYRAGLLHREGGPAVDFPWKKKWYKDGLLSREDGPAVIRSDDLAKKECRPLLEWHLNGSLHRVGGPAVIYPEHDQADIPLEEYWQEGELKRDDGPEIIWPGGEGWKREALWKSL